MTTTVASDVLRIQNGVFWLIFFLRNISEDLNYLIKFRFSTQMRKSGKQQNFNCSVFSQIKDEPKP